MTEHHGALSAARVVFASVILIIGEGGSVRFRAGQNIVLVRSIAAAVVDRTFFRQRGLLGNVVRAMKLGDVLRNCHSLGIHPWSLADAVAGIYSAGSLRREVGMPGLGASASRCREILAMTIGAGDTAKIRALALAGAGHKKRHVCLLRVDGCA